MSSASISYLARKLSIAQQCPPGLVDIVLKHTVELYGEWSTQRGDKLFQLLLALRELRSAVSKQVLQDLSEDIIRAYLGVPRFSIW